MAASTKPSKSLKNTEFCAWLYSAHQSRHATVRSYDYRVSAWLKWSAGRQPATELLREYGTHLRLDRRLRPRTLETHYAALVAYCQYLYAAGRLHLVPDCSPLRGGRLDLPDRPVAYSEDLALLWGAVWALPEHTLRERYVKWRAALCLALCCYVGARRSETLDLELSDIRRGDPWKVFIRDGKGGEARWLPVHPDLQAIMERWFPIREEWVAKCGHTSDALIPVDRVRRLGEAGLTEVIRMLAERAGIERRLTPHAFRHWTISTTCEQKGLKAAQEVAGHQSPRTTEKYLHASPPARMEAAVRSLPSFIPAPIAPPPSEAWRSVI